jgi:amidase
MFRSKRAFVLLAIALAAAEAANSQQVSFHLEEATIDDVHRAIRDGKITCRGLIQLYINRAKAYNGVSNVLVTKEPRQ